MTLLLESPVMKRADDVWNLLNVDVHSWCTFQSWLVMLHNMLMGHLEQAKCETERPKQQSFRSKMFKYLSWQCKNERQLSHLNLFWSQQPIPLSFSPAPQKTKLNQGTPQQKTYRYLQQIFVSQHVFFQRNLSTTPKVCGNLRPGSIWSSRFGQVAHGSRYWLHIIESWLSISVTKVFVFLFGAIFFAWKFVFVHPGTVDFKRNLHHRSTDTKTLNKNTAKINPWIMFTPSKSKLDSTRLAR